MDTLRLTTAIDLAPLQSGMPEAAAIVQQNTAAMVASFRGVAAESAAATAKIGESFSRVSRGEMAEASHAVRGLGEEIGVHMPRFVSNWVASLGPVQSVMASAFSAVAVVGLIEAIPQVVEKISAIADAWDGMRAAQEAALKESGKLLEEFERQATRVQEEIYKKAEREHGEQYRLQLELADKTLALNSDLVTKQRQAQDEITKLKAQGVADTDERMLAAYDKLDNALKERQLTELEVADLEAQLAKQSQRVAEARVEAEQKTGLALIAAREAYVREQHEQGLVSLEAEVAVLKEAGREKGALEVAAANAHVDAVRREHGNVLEAEVKANAQIVEARIKYQAELDKIDAGAAAEQKKIAGEMERFWVDYFAGIRKENEKSQTESLALLDERLKKELAATETERKAQEEQARSTYELGRTRIEGNTNINTLQKVEQLKALEIQYNRLQEAAAMASLAEATAGGDPAAIAKAQAQIQQITAQHAITMAKLNAEAAKSAVMPWESTFRRIGELSSELVTGMISGHKKLSEEVTRVWEGMLQSMVRNLMQGVTEHVIAVALHRAEAQKEVLISAKTAAAKAWDAFSWSPVGVVLGAASAAATFAGIMALSSFDVGGLVPRTQLAMVHGGERVLTERQNTTFERLVQGGGGGDTHYHAAPGESPDSVTRNAAQFQRWMRDGRLRFA
jgi:hypothetical protein